MSNDSDIKRAGGEEAAGWVVRMASDQRTRQDEARFRDWLEQDADNAEAYAEHALLWTDMGALADDREARALLGMVRPDGETPRFDRRRLIAVGAAGAIAASGALLFLPLGGTSSVYETAAGQQHRLMLDDGSTVILNTDSRIEVSLSQEERRIRLVRGQAYFNVASDPARSFRVFAGDDEIRAVGTAFEVRRVKDGVRVILEEGVVALYRGRQQRGTIAKASEKAAERRDRPAALLKAGEQANLPEARAGISVQEVDLGRAQAWRFGRLVLDDARLDETVEDLNRYGGRRIILGDPSLGALRVSGVFHTSRPESFVDGVSSALPVRVARQDEHSILLERR